MAEGASISEDENYIIESTKDPNKKILLYGHNNSNSSYTLLYTLNVTNTEKLGKVHITPDGLYGVVGTYSKYFYVIKNINNTLSIIQNISSTSIIRNPIISDDFQVIVFSEEFETAFIVRFYIFEPMSEKYILSSES